MTALDLWRRSDERGFEQRRCDRERACRLLLLASVVGLVAVVLFTGAAAATGADATLEDVEGEGTTDEPYVITNVEELQAIDTAPDAHYVLGDDIDASETREWNGYAGFEPIATEGTFTGSLDGRGYEIRDLVLDRPAGEGVGLVANVTGSIENVALVDVTVVGDRKVGAVAGIAHEDATVTRVSVSGAVTGDRETGGLLGRSAGEIEASTSSATLEAVGDTRRSRLGGLVGYLADGSIERSTAAGDATGIRAVGGLVGIVADGAYVSDSYATGNVTGVDHEESGPYFGWEESSHVGGLVGASGGSVATSFATGEVTGTNRYHGLFGSHNRAVDVYWDVDASGRDSGSEDDDPAMAGRSTDEMTGPGAADAMDALDFERVFQTTDDDYPILRSELEPATLRLHEVDGPDELTVGETTTVTATVENTGEREGTGTVSLSLGGSTVETTTLTLEPDERETVTLAVTAESDGESRYAVATETEAAAGDEWERAIAVAEESDSGTDALTGFGVVIALVALSVAVAVGRRR